MVLGKNTVLGIFLWGILCLNSAILIKFLAASKLPYYVLDCISSLIT